MNNVMPPEQLAEISKMLNQVKGQSGGQVKTATTSSEEEQMLQIFNLLKFMQRLVSMCFSLCLLNTGMLRLDIYALNTSMFDKASFKISILKAKKAPKLSNKLTKYTF